MFKSYLRIAINNILREKFYAILNVAGLAIGLACFILICLWIKDELSYDRHFKDHDRIYRLESSLVTEGIPKPMAATDPRLIFHLRDEYPNVCEAVRVHRTPTLLSVNSKVHYDEQALYADSTFFNIFSFEFLIGDPQTALLQPGSVVLTESVAVKLFGKKDPVGDSILINNNYTKAESRMYIITAVIKDNLRTSHFHPGAIIRKKRNMDNFEIIYIRLNDGYSPEYFADHVWHNIYLKYFKGDYQPDGQDITLDRVQPLARIHLGQNKWEDLEQNGNAQLVYIFAAIGVLILLLSCINYINLATARSFSRAREIGVRKVLGAGKGQIITQFLTEAVLTSLIALLMVLSFVELSLAAFNDLSDKQLHLNIIDPLVLCSTIFLAIFVGLSAGAYPAFFISAFQPVRSLKGMIDVVKNKPTLRKTLVVIQFSISIAMLIATIVIAQQLRFMKSRDLGFDTTRMLLVDLSDQKANTQRSAIKDALLKNNNVLKVSASYNIPGSEVNHTYISFEVPGGMQAKLINSMFVDHDFIRVMGLQLKEGIDFDSSMQLKTDTSAFIIINESAKKMLGYNDAIGKKIGTGKTYGYRDGKIIGVVKDFHAASLRDTIEPMVLALGTLGRPEGKSKFLTIKIKGTDVGNTIRFIENTYKSFGQGYPFQYSFLDEQFNAQYKKEEKQKILFYWFAGLSIFSSFLGLIGLTAYFTRQRAKEISIRRIAGASIFDIIRLMAYDFMKLLLISWLIACPVAYIAMSNWLNIFAYHISVKPTVLLIAGFATMMLAFATLAIQSLIAIKKNPATILKYE